MKMCLVGAHPLPPVALCSCLTLEVFKEHLDVALTALLLGHGVDSVIPEVFFWDNFQAQVGCYGITQEPHWLFGLGGRSRVKTSPKRAERGEVVKKP